MQALLSLENITYSYHNLNGETPALSDITFHVTEGEFLAIVGPRLPWYGSRRPAAAYRRTIRMVFCL